MKTKVYLATCYSYLGLFKWIKPLKLLIEWLRFKKVTKITAYLLLRGYNIFSPITHSHPLSKYIPDRLNTPTLWLELDFQWIDCCDELWVLCQRGWKKSYGVEREIKYAKDKGKAVRFLKSNGKEWNYSKE